MKHTRGDPPTNKLSGTEFTGDVYMSVIKTPGDGSRLSVSHVRFTPGARTAWHTHPNGQLLYVTDGVGRAGRRGQAHVLRPGDRVFFDPGEDHWHGAGPDTFMSHLSIVEADENGNPATWGEKVTDEEYGAEAQDG